MKCEHWDKEIRCTLLYEEVSGGLCYCLGTDKSCPGYREPDQKDIDRGLVDPVYLE